MATRLLIFDFDGTLADSVPVLFDLMNEAAELYGFRRMTRDDFERLRALPNREAARELEVAPWRAPMLARFMRRRMAEERARVTLFPGVAEVLAELRARGVAVAVVSTNAEANVRAIMGSEVAALVDHYGCGAPVFGKRPLMRRALRDCGVTAREALAIGDELRDLEAARGEGIPFGAVTWGIGAPATLRAAAPDHLFERVSDILPAVS